MTLMAVHACHVSDSTFAHRDPLVNFVYDVLRAVYTVHLPIIQQCYASLDYRSGVVGSAIIIYQRTRSGISNALVVKLEGF